MAGWEFQSMWNLFLSKSLLQPTEGILGDRSISKPHILGNQRLKAPKSQATISHGSSFELQNIRSIFWEMTQDFEGDGQRFVKTFHGCFWTKSNCDSLSVRSCSETVMVLNAIDGNSECIAISLSWFASAVPASLSFPPAILIRYPNPVEPATCK